MKGDCFKQMKDAIQQSNFQTGQKVFHIKEIRKLLKNYSDPQIQRTAKEHLKARNDARDEAQRNKLSGFIPQKNIGFNDPSAVTFRR